MGIPPGTTRDMRLTAKDLTCVRGGRTVFAGLALTVESGTALAITGRNGAGKSSLLRLLAGLIPKASGQVELAGGDAELTLAEQAHYLGHRDALKPALSVMENLLFWRDFLGGDSTASEPLECLARVAIDHIANLPAAYLSAGQRRRLSIARLIAVRRPVWLLDEPTSALDTVAQATLADLMREHLAGGGLLLAATHGPLGLAGATRLHIGAPLTAEVELS